MILFMGISTTVVTAMDEHVEQAMMNKHSNPITTITITTMTIRITITITTMTIRITITTTESITITTMTIRMIIKTTMTMTITTLTVTT